MIPESKSNRIITNEIELHRNVKLRLLKSEFEKLRMENESKTVMWRKKKGIDQLKKKKKGNIRVKKIVRC